MNMEWMDNWIPDNSPLCAEQFPLLYWYPGQTEPQKAFLAISEDGDARFDWGAEIGNAVPADARHGRTLRFDPSDAAGTDASLVSLFKLGEYDSVNEFYKQEFSQHQGVDGMCFLFDEEDVERTLKDEVIALFDKALDKEDGREILESLPLALRKLAMDNGIVKEPSHAA